MTDELRTILRQEFDAEGGSFLLQLRCELTWDQVAFERLAGAMEACCIALEQTETVERWLANGFWFIPSFIRVWASHENFPRPLGSAYYEEAFQRLDDLAYWFFFGENPRLGNRS